MHLLNLLVGLVPPGAWDASSSPVERQWCHENEVMSPVYNCIWHFAAEKLRYTDRSGEKNVVCPLMSIVSKCRKASVILVKETCEAVLFHSLRAELSSCLQPMLLVLSHLRSFSQQISLSNCISLAYVCLQCAECWNRILIAMDTGQLL